MVIVIRDKFQWDDAKSARCEEIRSFDFAFAVQIWRGTVKERVDSRKDYGEVRIQALGQISGEDYFLVYTWREGRRHIISARRAHLTEVLKWERSL